MEILVGVAFAALLVLVFVAATRQFAATPMDERERNRRHFN